MGRGLSSLQKYILNKVRNREHINTEIVLSEFYNYERVEEHKSWGYTVDWYKNGEKLRSSGLYYTLDRKGLVSITGEADKAKQAFYHSIQNLKKRGLIVGSVKHGLSINNNAVGD